MPDDYTPSTDEVRRGFTAPAYKITPQREDESFAEFMSRLSMEGFEVQMASEAAFDRWLVKHDRDVQGQALKDAVAEIRRAESTSSQRQGGICWAWEAADLLLINAIKLEQESQNHV